MNTFHQNIIDVPIIYVLYLNSFDFCSNILLCVYQSLNDIKYLFEISQKIKY